MRPHRRRPSPAASLRAQCCCCTRAGAAGPADAKVRVRLVDFAHTFQSEEAQRDANFLTGLRALLARLRGVVHAQLQTELT